MPAHSNKRLVFLALFLIVWCLAICVRLVILQVVHYQDFKQKAEKQQQLSVPVTAERGILYDRNGNALAMSVKVDSVFAVSAEIPDIHNTSGILAKVLKADPSEIESRMQASRVFAWVARKIDADTSARIQALKLKGIYFPQEPKRFYPKPELAAQVIGYVGLDDKGLAGLERLFDARLKGRPGNMLISKDAKGRWFGRVEKDPAPGENIVLTIDEKIQYIVERELEQAMKDTHAEAGAIIVQNSHTGEVLAFANRPTFNPNSVAATDVLENPGVSNFYEPGSTFKLVTLSAALEEKLTTPDEKIDCQMGSIVVNGLRIHDHHPYGWLSVQQILEHSSDVGAIKLALRLGKERFARYISAFGFGAQTGIELPHETRGRSQPVNKWSGVSIGAISMGQEVGVSPVQLISMVNTIANDGVYIPPRIIMGTTAPRNTPQAVVFHPPQGRRVISAMTAAQMKQMMEGVVLRGTGSRAMLNGYSVAGKTGTAQKTDPATGAYSRTDYIASFTGFAPVNNPALTILVILDSPVGPHEGGEVAAPVWARVAQQALAYLNVPHDRDVLEPRVFQARTKVKNEDVAEGSPQRLGMEAEEIAPPPSQPAAPPQKGNPALPQKGNPDAAANSGTPATAVPAVSAPAHSSNTIVLEVAGGVPVPDFSGKPLRAALEQAQEAGLELEVSGSGVAQSQSPPPGSHIAPGGRVNVRFGR